MILAGSRGDVRYMLAYVYICTKLMRDRRRCVLYLITHLHVHMASIQQCVCAQHVNVYIDAVIHLVRDIPFFTSSKGG